ncbi:MAG: hypothetical protein ACYC1E_15040 [Propionibacteriaceae bacterium]
MGPAGVPPSDGRGPREELAPVFTALARDIEAARRLVEQAEKDSADLLDRARDDASALLARAQQDSRSARAEAAARVTRESADDDEALLSTARDEADALAGARSRLIPELARSVIDRMLTEWLRT